MLSAAEILAIGSIFARFKRAKYAAVFRKAGLGDD